MNRSDKTLKTLDTEQPLSRTNGTDVESRSTDPLEQAEPSAQQPSAQQPSTRQMAWFEGEYSFSTSILHPQILKQLNELVPGAAERILSWTEEETKHRREMEKADFEFVKEQVHADMRDARLGLHYGFLITLMALVAGGVVAALGHEIGGTILGTSGVATLAGTFIYGSRRKRQQAAQEAGASQDSKDEENSSED